MNHVSTSALIEHNNLVPTSPLVPYVARANALPQSASGVEGLSIKSNSQITPPLLSRKAAAKYLGVAAQTLAQWACTGRYNLPFVKIGRSVKYRQSALDTFISSRTRQNGTTDQKGWQQ